MSDFEMLSIVLMILSIVVTVLIAYINQSKSNRPRSKDYGYFLSNKIIWTNQLSVVPFYILILTNTYSNVKSDALTILLSNLIILSDLLHHLVHHFHIKLHHFMIQYTTLPFFKILQNTSKYKGLRSYINL